MRHFEPPQENLSFLRGCLFTFIKVGVSAILQLQCNTTIMSQQMDVSSIVRKDLQPFYSLDFDFQAAAFGPEIFLRLLRNKYVYL